MLRLIDLHKSFGNQIVLDDLNLDIKEGSVFGLVGINGAGKSTLLRCIAGIYQADAGITIFNDFDTYEDVNVRKDIFYVSDDCYYPSNATIKTLKEFYSSFYNVNEERYQEYLNVFGLKENIFVSNFSKGMKRQTSLLFALAIKPKLLLLDECFDGLDPLVRLTFKKSLVDLIADKEITVIIASHNLKELEDICDSYGILENGRINTYGDLLESKENITKFQLAYNEVPVKEKFTGMNILSYKSEGKVITLVVKGNKEDAKEKIMKTNPLLIDELQVNFEELFIYEVESRGLLNE